MAGEPDFNKALIGPGVGFSEPQLCLSAGSVIGIRLQAQAGAPSAFYAAGSSASPFVEAA